MRVVKMILAILSIVASIFALGQALLGGVLLSAVQSEQAVVAGGGILTAIALLVGGIAGLATMNSRTGNVITALLYLFGALIGFFAYNNYGKVYADLQVWAGLCVICAIAFFVPHSEKKKPHISKLDSEE